MSTKKPVVLALVHYYLPGYKSGGPVRTIANLVDHLSDDIEFLIVTSDRDALDGAPYPDIRVDAWNPVGKALVYYVSPTKQTIRGLLKLVAYTRYDVLYLNSFFDPIFTQRPLLARRFGLLPSKPVVIAPRGEFSPGALTFKRWKKLPYKWFATAMGLYRGLIWQASNDQEASDIRRAIGATARNICVTPNLPQSSAGAPQDNAFSKTGGSLRVVFLSRITPVKNLDFALKVMARVKINVQFDIYGPIRAEAYWRQCEALMVKLPHNVLARYKGPVEHSEVTKILQAYDLFFLPTRSENFGHVILESFAAGTPVLIANTTPWRNLEETGIGWDLPLDDERAFVDRIHRTSLLSEEAFRIWRQRVYNFAREYAANPEIVASNRNLFIKIFTGLERVRS